MPRVFLLENVALFPEEHSDLFQKRSVSGIVQNLLGLQNAGGLLCLAQRCKIHLQVCDAELRQTVLPASEEVAGTAQRKILFGE